MIRRLLLGVLLVVLVVGGVLSIELLRTAEPPEERIVAILHAGSDDDDTAFAQPLLVACSDCLLREVYADHDVARQREQFARALDDGADVVVLEAVAADAGEELVLSAGSVPVVALGSFVPGADWFAGRDDRALGRLLGRAVAREASGPVLVIDPPAGSPGLVDGVLAGLGRTQVAARLADLTGGPEARRAQARAWVARQLGRGRVPGAVVALDEDAAAGAVTALQRGRVVARNWPLVTGVGDGLPALRRLILGTQALTGHLDGRGEAEAAARLAAAVITGDPAPGTTEFEGVSSVLLEPRLITLDTLTNTVVRDGEVTIDQLCDGETSRRCEELGLR